MIRYYFRYDFQIFESTFVKFFQLITMGGDHKSDISDEDKKGLWQVDEADKVSGIQNSDWHQKFASPSATRPSCRKYTGERSLS